MKQSILILPIILFPLLISSPAFAAGDAVKSANLDSNSLLLLTAAQKGDAETVGRLIAEQVHIDAKDDYGRTPLYVAVENGHAEVAALLIEAGADIEARTYIALHYWRWTPLMVAVHWGHTSVAELLIAAGADVNARDEGGNKLWTILHYAANRGHIGVAELLIANGADVETKVEPDLDTPLFYAARTGDKAMAELLISKAPMSTLQISTQARRCTWRHFRANSISFSYWSQTAQTSTQRQ